MSFSEEELKACMEDDDFCVGCMRRREDVVVKANLCEECTGGTDED